MDYIYGNFNKSASPKIEIENYFVRFLGSIISTGFTVPTSKDEVEVFDLMGLDMSEDDKTMLSTYCSIDNLTVENEMPKIVNGKKSLRKDTFDPKPPADVDLQTLQYLKKRLLTIKDKRPVCKYRGECDINYKEAVPSGELLVPGEEILVFVKVYDPFNSKLNHEPGTQMGLNVALNSVIAVLGSQTLADVRDRITCQADYSISAECSEDPRKVQTTMAKDVYKSGFFYIEDTFYNDTRDPSNVDYSKVILEWAKRRAEIGPFDQRSMESCRIDSMAVRFGFPWVYQHQGSCEHLICFSDARLVDLEDEIVKSEYPRIARVKPRYSRLCMICGYFCANWVTMAHEGIPHNPCFFCASCFKSYNYVNGKKVRSFLAYPMPRNIETVKGIADLNL